MIDAYLLFREAANRLGISRRTLRSFLADGLIDQTGGVLFAEREVNRFARDGAHLIAASRRSNANREKRGEPRIAGKLR